MEFDSVQIGVADVEDGARTYEQLLGCVPLRNADGAIRFQLRSGAIEIEPGLPGLHGVRFRAASAADGARWSREGFRGLHVSFTDVAAPAAVESGRDGIVALDHVVIHCADLDDAIALWRDRLGLRLALDRAFAQRGLRLVFFRSGGVTLEFAGRLPPPDDRSGPDIFYGLAYRVSDLEACRGRLLRSGFDLSEVRRGHKPGTHVASVRSGTAGVPTLLIEDPGRAP